MKHMFSICALTLTLAVAGPVAGQSCDPARDNEEVDLVLRAVHAAHGGNDAQRQRFMREWATVATSVTTATRRVDAWQHAAVDVARLLLAEGRRVEAQQILETVVRVNDDTEWGRRAAARLENIEKPEACATSHRKESR